ncbi:dienelactone hydrolase family protein [Phenylobacterium sp. LjRoot219]|uniref:dienelactone hydrolase family protein n=1 Tax=Phenylobacterium sp. LjRoot219 TaxID=3342283 RepID=UPI003ECC2916
MIEQTVDIPTPAGAASTFIAHPERDGPHPLVIVFMDAPGVREELRGMARRLASVGYYVMLPNLYYRAGVEEMPHLTSLPTSQAREEVYELMSTLATPAVMEDAEALLDYADRDPAASPGLAGCIGYCMSGQYAVNFAARHPERIGAAASIYGVKLVTDQDDSPHLILQRATAEFYFACAEHDDWSPVELAEPLEQAAKAYGPPTEVEIYAGAHHGFAFPERPVYDLAAAERHWERLFSLFRRRLQAPAAVAVAEQA